MTRINVLDPRDLTDQHLLAEYRELPRIFALAYDAKGRAYDAIPDLVTISIVQRHERAAVAIRAATTPATYTLGAGHVRFFYPRTGYLARRQAALIAECRSRGFAIAHDTPPPPVPGLDDDWTPDPAALAVNLARLREKLAAGRGPDARPYTYGGAPVPPTFYDRPTFPVL